MTTPATDFAAPAPVADGHRLRRRVFPGRADQVARAREFTARTLAGCPAVADAVLLTSELGTNALLHTATGTGGGLVPSGRGLLLVASLAARWGYHGSGQGRVTWFELPCTARDCAGPG